MIVIPSDRRMSIATAGTSPVKSMKSAFRDHPIILVHSDSPEPIETDPMADRQRVWGIACQDEESVEYIGLRHICNLMFTLISLMGGDILVLIN